MCNDAEKHSGQSLFVKKPWLTLGVAYTVLGQVPSSVLGTE